MDKVDSPHPHPLPDREAVEFLGPCIAGLEYAVLVERQSLCEQRDKESTNRYCIYILSCADGSFYTGMTSDLPRRLAEHRASRGDQRTQRRRPVELVSSLEDLGYRSVREVERYIKSLSRARKEALVEREPGMLALVRKRV